LLRVMDWWGKVRLEGNVGRASVRLALDRKGLFRLVGLARPGVVWFVQARYGWRASLVWLCLVLEAPG